MKPILFNTDMVRAVLDGRKTMTRRVANQIAPNIHCQVEGCYDHEFIRDDFADGVYTGFVCRKCGFGVSPPHGKYPVGESCIRPPYSPGDILYVRETWSIKTDDDCIANKSHKCPYKSCENHAGPCVEEVYIYKASDILPDSGCRWHPSIHMPLEAARIFLRVTDVRVERLQTPFFAEGCVIRALQKEGIDIGDTCRECLDDYDFPNCNDLDPELDFDEETGEDAGGGSECGNLDGVRYKFSTLWDSTIKPKDRDKYGWAANPWVWVISFERIEKPEATQE